MSPRDGLWPVIDVTDKRVPANTVAPPARVNILGVGVSAINMPMALAQIDAWIRASHMNANAPAHSPASSHYVCVTGVHGIIESQDDEALRQIHNSADLVTPDGMPLVWLCRGQGHPHVGRVYGPDLMLAVCEYGLERGYRHYFFGGAPGTPEKLVARLQSRWPTLQVAGLYSPPFRAPSPQEDEAMVAMLNAARADVIWVGLSTPKQERWMAGHVTRLHAPALIGVGAAFDFHAGLKRQAPLWMQRNGLEWLFRLVTEPRRLWRRYLGNNPRFAGLLLLQRLGLRRWTL